MLDMSSSTSAFPENTDRENDMTSRGGSGPVSGRFGEEERLKVEDSDRIFGGNRWPRQETLALLKIRSDMDVAFRDSSVKAPLWEQVSRKLAELGYNRSTKKCKEKFENIYKYHKRAKEGRSGRQNGKNYRFFEQLEALETLPLLPPPSQDIIHTSMAHRAISATKNISSFMDKSTPTTSGSSKESEGTREEKHKLAEFFERLMKEVVEKQADFQMKFIETLEKCEQDRITREEAWKSQELVRIKRERELLAQEQTITAAKDAAVLAFLKKFSDQPGSMQNPENPTLQQKSVVAVEKLMDKQNEDSFGFVHSTSSRWPKDEIDALIRLRTNLEFEYQENRPKGPLWEEISVAMKKLGYDRTAKRCKEKWENINKYFKKVKERNRKRSGDSKTCPYFHQLDALYKEKKSRSVNNSVSFGYELKPEDLLMNIMNGEEEKQGPDLVSENVGIRNITDQNEGEKGDNEGGDEEDGYVVVAKNSSSMGIMG